jgi:hypothetical protein
MSLNYQPVAGGKEKNKRRLPFAQPSGSRTWEHGQQRLLFRRAAWMSSPQEGTAEAPPPLNAPVSYWPEQAKADEEIGL